jgi:Uncharacterized membrane protein, required for colicin V production
MNTFDFVVIIPVVAGLIFGLFRGLIKEVTGLVAIFLGIYISKMLAPTVGVWLVQIFNVSENISVPVAYLVIFVAIMLLCLIVSSLLNKLIKAISLGGINSLLGGLFGAIKLALIVSVLLNVFDVIDQKYHFVEPDMKTESFSYSHIINLAPTLWDEAQQNIKQ